MSDDKIIVSMDEVERATPVPGSTPPPVFTPGYEPPAVQPEPPRKRTGLFIGLAVAVFAVLVLTGIGIAAVVTANGGGKGQIKQTPPQTDARLIEEAIEYDHRVSEETIGRKARVDGVNAECDEDARARREYVSRMRQFLLSNSNLPADFRSILFEHISAHNRFADILASHPLLPNDYVESFGIGFLNYFLGKGVDGGAGEMNQWVNEGKIAAREISETWDAVLQCAIKYGAQIDQEE